MRIGRWSEERSWIALHEERRARSGEAKDMSGEVWLVLGLKGLRVGVSVSLRMLSWWSWLSKASPRLSEVCEVSQAGS